MRHFSIYASELKWLACAFYLILSAVGNAQTDQELVYGSYLGGLDWDNSTCIEQSQMGYWLIGETSSLNFPVTPNALFTSPRGLTDITVTHLNSALSEINYSTYWGGIGEELVFASAISSNGHLAISGFTNSANFPTEGLNAIEEKPGGSDNFITVFDPEGSVVWSTYFGGVGNDRILDLAYDNNGFLYAVGFTTSPNLATPNAYSQTLEGLPPASDGFMCKFDSNGGLLWFSYYGGLENDGIGDIEISDDERIFFSGTSLSNGIATPGSYQTQNNGNSDFIIGEIDSNGFPIWITYYGGSELDGTIRIIQGEGSTLFLAGITASADLTGTQNGFQPNFGGEVDLFLTRFDFNGNHLWSSYFGGSFLEPDCFNIKINKDNFGNYVIASSTGSTNNVIFGSNPLDGGPPSSISGKGLISKISSGSNLPIWSTYLLEGCGLVDLVINDSNNIVGVTGLNDSDPSFITPNALQPTYGGGGSDGAIIVIQDNIVTSTVERQTLDFQLYPNPTAGLFQIQSPHVVDRLEIYDQLGRLVNERKPIGTQFELDISALPSGIYLVRALSGQLVGSSKMIKQ